MAIRVITGASTGIGAALRAHYQAAGDQVINIDWRDGDITADLATAQGRADALAQLVQRCPDGIQSFAAVAGLGAHNPQTEKIVALNYFGAISMTEGALPLLLQGRGHALVVASNSAAMSEFNPELMAALEAGDEPLALQYAATLDGFSCYGASKRALVYWMRKTAVSWAAHGVRLNAVAPGATDTPLLQASLEDPAWGDAIRQLPVPLGGFATSQVIAQSIAFLLSEASCCTTGSVLFVDGGTDSLLRPRQF